MNKKEPYLQRLNSFLFIALAMTCTSCVQSEDPSTQRVQISESEQRQTTESAPPTNDPVANLPTAIDPNEITVRSVEEFKERVKALAPGDHLLLDDGVYDNIGNLQFEVSGTPERPIVIRPKNPHQVTIEGELRWRISGSHLTFEGLNFLRVKKVPSDKYYDSLIGSNYDTRGLRFTGCRFISCEVEQRENGSIKGNLIALRGDRHRIDNCFFYDPLSGMIGINGDKALMEQRIKGEIRIDHNIFRDMTRLRALEGQGEAIFMGSGFSHYRTQPLGAIVEYNIFDQAIGDTHGEIITVKCSDNIFRRNLFVNGPGVWFEGGSHLSLRHTDNCEVTENLFQNLGCGIWVTGRNHLIKDNYFIDIDYAGLYFPSGNLLDVVDDQSVIMVDEREINMSSDGAYPLITREYGAVFWAAENCTIENNYFGDLKKFGFYMRDNTRANHGFIPPTGNRVFGNVFQVIEQVEALPLMHIDQPELNDITENLYTAPRTVNLGKLGEDPKIRSQVPDEWEQRFEALKAELPPIPPMPGSLEDQALRAEFKPFNNSVYVGEFLMLDAAHSAGVIETYAWDFGDGNRAIVEGNAIAHKWTQPGTYVVELRVVDARNNIQSYKQEVTVVR